ALAGAVPVALVAVVAWRTPLVGALLAITLPIVVVFLVLVGLRSAEHARDRQRALAVLGAHFLEVVRGLPTLRAHGREHAQLPTLRLVSDRYRDESLGALRVAFLSALVLEVLAMLGTAVAAAVVGVQLAEGRMTLEVGLFVLLLAPEIYTPFREAGQRFHAAEDGTEAAQRALAFLDEPDPLGAPPVSERPSPDPAQAPITLTGVAVRGGAGRLDSLAPVDLTVVPGSNLALVGASGAGKTTLLALLARLRDPDDGTVRCGTTDLREITPETWWRRVAWLPQRPALPAGQLGEVLHAAAAAADGPAADPSLTRARLERALHWADAAEVIADLEDGLATKIGPGGRQLSAGQVQRLCLAAALASSAPLLLLDEPTAHLDPDSAERVRDGILDAAGERTVVVATHDELLAARCDAVVRLGAADTEHDTPVAPRPAAVAPDRTQLAAVAHPSRQAAEGEPSHHRTPQRRPLRAPGRPLLLGATSAIAGVAVLAVSGWLIVHASEQPPVLALLSAIVIVRALGLVRALARYGERLSGHDVALRRLADRRVDWYRRLAARVGAPDLPDSPDLLTRFTADVDALQDRDLRVRHPAAVAAIVSLTAAAAAALLLPAAGLALVTGALIGGVCGPGLAWAAGRRAAARQAPARSRLAALLDEVMQLGPVLALQGLADDRRQQLGDAAERLARADRALARAATVGGALTAIGGGVALAGTLLFAAQATAAGTLAPVALGAVVLLAVGLQEVLRPLPEAALRLMAVQHAETRLAAVTDGPPALSPPPAVPAALPRRGPLHAWNLHYRPGGQSGPQVLTGAALTVMPGERVAIVGPSGAGKSTLVQLLGRLSDPDEGSVSLGGVDLRDATEADIRQRIRVAGQDAHLLAGTLAANLRIGAPDADEPALTRALDAVGLGPWLAALPDGLQTLVGEDGAAVSGGQRQRLSVARALLSPAELLLLDEPTAMLDGATAAALLHDALAAAPGRTVIVVIHDGDRLDLFDRVLELRDGQLRERVVSRESARATASAR
ncbi:MAG: thiol reductant ABC exporter subunit CydC, partial [Solirubrobacteraceae bacterium]|nr:thiol reductant ABC exporter subunit CydC [Solirubrobacteraceae bacterium]